MQGWLINIGYLFRVFLGLAISTKAMLRQKRMISFARLFMLFHNALNCSESETCHLVWLVTCHFMISARPILQQRFVWETTGVWYVHEDRSHHGTRFQNINFDWIREHILFLLYDMRQDPWWSVGARQWLLTRTLCEVYDRILLYFIHTFHCFLLFILCF